MTPYETAVRSLSEEVLKLLRERGWSEDRRVSLDEARASLASVGAPLHAYAEELLQAFDGLQFYNPATDRSMKVSAEVTCDWFGEENLPYVQALFAPSACPVALGATQQGPITSMATASSGIFPDCWYFVAEDGRWLCIDIYWTGDWFLPSLDAVLRFALLNEGVQAGRVPLTREQCPPGTWDSELTVVRIRRDGE
jgi:hypothetical protein